MHARRAALQQQMYTLYVFWALSQSFLFMSGRMMVPRIALFATYLLLLHAQHLGCVSTGPPSMGPPLTPQTLTHWSERKEQL